MIDAKEVSLCVVLGKEYVASREGEVVYHPNVGPGIIVGKEDDGRLIVVFDEKHVSARASAAQDSLSAAAATQNTEASDFSIASTIEQMHNPFTVGAIAAQAPKPLEPDNFATCLGDRARAQEDAQKRAERVAAIDALMRELGML